MAQKPTLFVVTDIETTMKHRIAFDVAWKTIDRKGREYGRGSYIVKEAFKHDVPFFAAKLGYYFEDTFKGLIEPKKILEIRSIYNNQIRSFQEKGHRVVLGAYNSAFDFKYLPETCAYITENRVVKWLDVKAELIDIWDYWGESVPKEYSKVANVSKSGKYLSTSAEEAYRFEYMNRGFEEKHIAWADVEIEAQILLKTLARKKKLPIVKSPKELTGAVWKKINTRLGITGKEFLPQYQPASVGA